MNFGEIEKQILRFSNINTVSVSVKKDNNNREFICAYFISDDRISISELKNHLSKFLPNYMVPSYLIQLDDFKYTPNGKIDKNALPPPKFNSSQDIVLAETPTEIKLSKIWENLLCISPISIDDNFFEIGGDSILALKLQIELLNENINVTYADIFKYNTIKQLSIKIESAPSNVTFVENCNFDNINNVLKNNTIQNLKNLKRNKIGNVLLTGATGFLGAHILDYILSNTSSNIYCLIRKDPSTTPTEKLIKKLHYYFDKKYDSLIEKRIFVLNSDISKDNLDLSNSKQEYLAENIDCVINSAAIVRHYGYYGEFEKINVTSVKNLIDFCEKYSKKLIQISTISVSGNTLTDLGIQDNLFEKDIEFNETNLYINQPLENVYVRSKFEAEKIILEEIANEKLNASIFRIGNITNRSTDGKFQPNASENAFLNRLKAFMELKAVPNYIADDYVEFSPVDCIAEAIIKGIESLPQKCSVLHIYNQNHLYIRDLIKILPKNTIRIVDDSLFKEILNNSLKNSNEKDVISYISNDLNNERKLVYNSYIKIKNDFTKAFLSKIKFKWIKINKKYIEKIFKTI